MSRQNFYQPLTEWARGHGAGYTGIVRGQEPLNSMVAQQGDAVAIYRTFGHPGVAATGLAPASTASAWDGAWTPDWRRPSPRCRASRTSWRRRGAVAAGAQRCRTA